MSDDEQTGWIAMMGAIGIVGILVLALAYVPGVAPDEEVLACDRAGGYWVAAEGLCQRTDSPLAGLAA